MSILALHEITLPCFPPVVSFPELVTNMCHKYDRRTVSFGRATAQASLSSTHPLTWNTSMVSTDLIQFAQQRTQSAGSYF